MNKLYTPAEEAILNDYFGIGRPKYLKSVDIFKKTRKGACVTKDASNEKLRIPHAVARLLLARVQQRLPQQARPSGEDAACAGKTESGAGREQSLPFFLFRLNRADGAPAQAYHVVPVPGFDRYVVTASADSTDAHGVTEFAVGWFPAGSGWLEGAKAVLLNYWTGLGYGRGTRRREYVIEEGEVSREEVGRWVGEVWTGNQDPDKLDEKEGRKAACRIGTGKRELPADDPIYTRGYFVGMNRSGRKTADDRDNGDEPSVATGKGEPFDSPGFLQHESIERSLRITMENQRRNDRLSNKKNGR